MIAIGRGLVGSVPKVVADDVAEKKRVTFDVLSLRQEHLQDLII